ncbi:MAG: hypothetical protein FVQ79_08930, partial [Planctomycetes bacterium]|nr:hypothetical protein [Planctomycetota bacterium]
EAFAPDVIALEVGADALAGDPLAQLCLTNNVYADIIEKLLAFGKPILATGGGGYDVENTVRAWALCWLALCGVKDQGQLREEPIAIDAGQREMVDPVVARVIEEVKSNVFGYHGL